MLKNQNIGKLADKITEMTHKTSKSDKKAKKLVKCCVCHLEYEITHSMH